MGGSGNGSVGVRLGGGWAVLRLKRMRCSGKSDIH